MTSTRAWRPSWSISLDATLGPLTRGPRDPVCRRLRSGEYWLTGSTSIGPGSLHLRTAEGQVIGQAWGTGATWLLDRLPLMLGAADEPGDFQPDPAGLVGRQWRRWRHRWRVPKTGLVWQTLVLAILEQKVTGIEAQRAWFALCRDHGTPAPGPVPSGMSIVPDPTAVRLIPSWWWRRHGVDHSRASTLLSVARSWPADPSLSRLGRFPGIGPWTVAEVACRAFGDADAVSVGDYHLANNVGYALDGAHRSTDTEMLQLLSPFAPHRYRAVRMIELSGISAPRRGPRMALPRHH